MIRICLINVDLPDSPVPAIQNFTLVQSNYSFCFSSNIQLKPIKQKLQYKLNKNHFLKTKILKFQIGSVIGVWKKKRSWSLWQVVFRSIVAIRVFRAGKLLQTREEETRAGSIERIKWARGAQRRRWQSWPAQLPRRHRDKAWMNATRRRPANVSAGRRLYYARHLTLTDTICQMQL